MRRSSRSEFEKVNSSASPIRIIRCSAKAPADNADRSQPDINECHPRSTGGVASRKASVAPRDKSLPTVKRKAEANTNAPIPAHTTHTQRISLDCAVKDANLVGW